MIKSRHVRVAVVIILGMVAQMGFAQVQYVLRPLGVGSAGRGMKVGLNNLGQVAGKPTGALTFAWIWENGTLIHLGALGAGEGSSAADINDLGEVVGSSTFLAGNTTGHAFYYANGVMHDLTVISGLSVAQNSVASINSNSVAVGFAIGSDPFINGKPGLIWNIDPADPSNNTSVVAFPTLAKPLAVNDAGDVAGATLQFEEALVREDSSLLYELGQLPGSTFWGSWARDISVSRVVAGGGRMTQFTTHAARWDKAGGVYQISDLHPAITNLYPTAHSSDALAINEQEQIVGWFGIGGLADTAVMWDSTNDVVTLYDHLVDAQGWTDLQHAYDINERGQILVSGRTAAVQDELALLIPIPIPHLSIAPTSPPAGTVDILIAPTAPNLVYRMRSTTHPSAWNWYGPPLSAMHTSLVVRVTNEVPVRIYRCEVNLP